MVVVYEEEELSTVSTVLLHLFVSVVWFFRTGLLSGGEKRKQASIMVFHEVL